MGLTIGSCNEIPKQIVREQDLSKNVSGITLVVLGTVQDAGSPHIACKKSCCAPLFSHPDTSRKVVSLGLVDHESHKTYLFEASPDITEQVNELIASAPWAISEIPNGIFLTHAHIGHYTGLMYLGKEAANTTGVPVHAMPKMKNFLETNGPWSQLVTNNNIALHGLDNRMEIKLSPQLTVAPFTVPHRDEYSETVGYAIEGPNKSVLFIPDIDKWERWEENIIAEISKVDVAFLDATFYDGREVDNRDLSEIPHPFVVESLKLFANLPASEKGKIHFIHFNHTNPLLDAKSPQYLEVLENGFNIAKINQRISL